MVLINISVVLIFISLIIYILGFVLKKRKLHIISGILLVIVIIVWIALWIYASAKEEKLLESQSGNSNNTLVENITEYVEGSKRFYTGTITEIKDNKIIFKAKDEKNYLLEISENDTIQNGRTAEKIDITDIKIGYFIETSIDRYIYIYRNISGDELKKEILINLSLSADSNIWKCGFDIKEINKTGNNSAIVTVEVYDKIHPDYYNNVEIQTFEMAFVFNASTKYHSKGGNIYNVDTLDQAIYNINWLKLDPSTIDKKNLPVVEIFESSDS